MVLEIPHYFGLIQLQLRYSRGLRPLCCLPLGLKRSPYSLLDSAPICERSREKYSWEEVIIARYAHCSLV